MSFAEFSEKEQFVFPRRSRLCLVAVLLSLAGAGCGIPGALYGIFIHPLIPPATIKAEYDMSDKSVLVWVDDTVAAPENPLLRRYLTRQIQQQLLEHHAAHAVIEYDRIVRFRQQHPDVAQIAVQQLGRQLHADHVLYILVEQFQLHHETAVGFFRLSLVGYAKVIDVATGNRVWPVDQTQRPFTQVGELTQGVEQDLQDRLVRELSQNVARQIARFFYKHQQPK